MINLAPILVYFHNGEINLNLEIPKNLISICA